MIEIRNVSKVFDNLEALKNINLNVAKGSIYGLLGSNGSGKTTLLKLLAGIYKQNTGELNICNESVFENIKVKSQMVFMPDSPYFFPQHTIKHMANYYKSIYKSWSCERYEKLKQVFNMDVDKKISSLSKGMQRQVAFWLAFSIMPNILILDEPLDGLDPIIRQKVKNLIIHEVAARELTVIIASHNLREIEDICDHVGILHEGTLILEKDIDDLKSDIHKIQIAFKGTVPDGLLNNAHILHVEERGSVLLIIIRGSNVYVTDYFNNFNPVIIDIIPLTLEEIFIYEMEDVGYEIQNVIL
ncbi:ABC transporter ATP-binding protein [Clostridium sp.]|uniref:ABC transporter ATP-binding protein n=1 Tax=Clostridium sp. TaxID=1506 RepID=UPI003D6CB051